MSVDSQLTILLTLLFIHCIVCAFFSKAILVEEPKTGTRILLFTLLWSLPVIGVMRVYKLLELQWFSNEEGTNRTGGIAFNFLEIDAIFNPGSKHVLQEQQREKMEISKQGKDR